MIRSRVRVRILTALALIALIVAACSSSDGEETEPASAAGPTSTKPTGSDVENDDEIEDPIDRDFDEVTSTVDAFVTERNLEGAGLIVVHKNDGVLYEEYFGTFDAERISLIASASKMISAGVLLRLQDDGLLDMDAPIEGTVDWAVGNPDITPAQLLSNSSGLIGLRPDFLYEPYLCQWSAPDELQECGEAVFTTAADDSDQIPPDSEFRYGGAQWQLAGAVAEAVSGKTWDQLINDTYVAPCDVNSLGYISLGALGSAESGYPTVFAGDPSSVAPSANPGIGGGVYITAPDYAKLLLMHLRGGTCGDNQVLSQTALDTMHTDRIAETYGGDAGANRGYGMGWWVDRKSGRISDNGVWGAVSWLDLDDDYGTYLVLEDEGTTGFELKREVEGMIHSVVTDS